MAEGGGIGRFTQGLLEALPGVLAEGEEIVAPADPAAGALGRAVSRLPRRKGSTRPILRLLHEQTTLARIARHVDVVHLADLRPLLASDTPFLITVHDVTFLDHPEWFPRGAWMYKRTMLRAALAKGPGLIACVSGYARDRLLVHHPHAARSDIRVVHQGISLPPTLPAAGERPTEPYLLSVSTIEPRKNHATVLAALRKVRAAGLDIGWKVVGGPGHRSGPIVAELQDAEGVSMLGRVSDEELEKLYAGALFVVMPSHVEGFGYPPLEAMARGVPVACSTGSAFDETVGDAALRVSPSDVDGWANAISTLASNGALREQLREAGRARASSFTWERAARAYADCYRALAPRA